MHRYMHDMYVLQFFVKNVLQRVVRTLYNDQVLDHTSHTCVAHKCNCRFLLMISCTRQITHSINHREP